MKRLSKMFGSKFRYRVDPSAPSADERERTRTDLPALLKTREAAERAMRERQRVLLLDPEFVQLEAEWKAARKAHAEAASALHHFKFTAGTLDGAGGLEFFRVHAQGDSWEDIFAKLKADKS